MKNHAILEFDHYKLLEFDQWYTPQVVEYLTHLNQQGDFLRYVFFDRNPGDIQSQFESIYMLKNFYAQSGKVKSIGFISKEPGLGENHFIFGLLIQNKIIIINPVGETDHQNFYEALSEFKEYSKADILLSNLVLQRDSEVGSGLVSCGPICIELMRHISLLPAASILELVSNGEESKEYELSYTKIDIQGLLPDKLCEILNCDPQVYKGKILEIRALHQNILSEHPSLKHLTTQQQNKFLENQCTNHPMQVVIKKHLQDGGMHRTEIIDEYLQQQENKIQSAVKQTNPQKVVSSNDNDYQGDKDHPDKAGAWYGYEKLSSLIQKYAPDVQVTAPASSLLGFGKQLGQIQQDVDSQYFIPLNINCLSQNFEDGSRNELQNNHWAGLYLIKSNGQVIETTYIDPMGKKINSDLTSVVTDCLGIDPNGIVQPLLNKPVQAVQLDLTGSFIEKGNTDDCGPFLVYCLAFIAKDKSIRQDIKTPEQSISFGQYLREAFSKEVSFDEICQTITTSSKVTLDKPHKTMTQTTGQMKNISVNEPTSDIFIFEDEQVLNDSIAELEKKLFPVLHSNTSTTLPNPEEERSKVLSQINTSYKTGLQYYQEGKLELAEQELVKVLKPVLSKPSMKNLYVNLEEVKDKVLDAIHHLGLVYLNEKETKYFEHHAKAAAIFQYCGAFAKKHKVGEVDYFLNAAHEVEKAFLESIWQETDSHLGSYVSSREQIEEYRSVLEGLRAETKQRLAEISNLTVENIGKRAEEVEKIYQDCGSFFVNHHYSNDSNKTNDSKPGLLQRLLADCHQQLGGPPEGCEHAVIALGSLSLGTMTPWSDLEFAILVNNEQHKEYFRNLSKLLHIKVINLGETHLKSMGVESLNNFKSTDPKDEWFWDDVMKIKFNFDSNRLNACKVGLGRQGNYQVKEKVKDESGVEKTIVVTKPDYELILTPAEMAAFQKEVTDETTDDAINWFKTDKHLVQALRSVSLIDGSQGSQVLLDSYRKEVKVAATKEILQDRALQILQENINEFNLKLGDEEEGKLLDTKQHIYRLGDRIVNGLANYYEIGAEEGQPVLTVWQMIEIMEAQEIISKEGAQHLKEAVAIATELRLRTYANNDTREEAFSTYVPAVEHLSEEQRNKFLHETFHFQDVEILKHFYYVMLRVQELVEIFCNQEYHEQGEILLKNDNLFADNNHIKGMVHARFLEYGKAIEHMEICQETLSEDLEFLQNLFGLYRKTAMIEKSLEFAEKILIMIKNQYANSSNLHAVSAGYNNLGDTYVKKGHYDKAIECYNEALKACDQVLDPSIAASYYNNRGTAYFDKGNYQEAIADYLIAKDISFSVCEQGHIDPHIAGMYDNLGNIYVSIGQFKQAIDFYSKALQISLEAHSSRPNHPAVARSLNGLGIVHSNMREYEEALKYFRQVLKIYKTIYGDGSVHPDNAGSYDHLGVVYYVRGDYENAIKNYKKGLDIRNEVYKHNPDHYSIASSYNNLGMAHAARGELDRSIEYFNKALIIQQKYYQSDLHPSIAKSYDNLGFIHRTNNDYANSTACYHEALKIQKKFYGYNLTHLDIASSYDGLGEVCCAEGNYKEALKHYYQALKIKQTAYQNLNNPDIATSYHSLGNAYLLKGDYEEAVKYHSQALEIKLEVYESCSNHPDILRSRNNLEIATNLQKVEVKIIGAFSTLKKIKDASSEVEIEISTKGLEKQDIKEYCKSKFGTNFSFSNITFSQNECSISLDRHCRDILRKQLTPQEPPTNSDTASLPGALSKSITNLQDIPDKKEDTIRMVSYNITADYYDQNDKTKDGRHHWSYRAPFVKILLKTMYPDIICLQELSPSQALDMHQYLGYKSVFLSQTPSDVAAGTIVQGEEVGEWLGKFMGTPLIGTFISNVYQFIEVGRFWLNEEPEVTPHNTDRGITDKGFGNINSYKAVLWAKIQTENSKVLFVFNSHYPLSGNNKTRLECAKLEMLKIQEITKGSNWISAGDRNIIPTKDDNEVYSPAIVRQELVRYGRDICSAKKHYGISTTWLGFSYDNHKNLIKAGDFESNTILDIMVSSLVPVCSFYHHGAINRSNQELIPLSGVLGEEHNEGHYFASDHALIGGDLFLEGV